MAGEVFADRSRTLVSATEISYLDVRMRPDAGKLIELPRWRSICAGRKNRTRSILDWDMPLKTANARL